MHCLLLNYHGLPWCVTITFSGWILQSIWHLNLVPRVYKIGMVFPWASVWSSNYIWSPKDVVECYVKRDQRIVRFLNVRSGSSANGWIKYLLFPESKSLLSGSVTLSFPFLVLPYSGLFHSWLALDIKSISKLTLNFAL